MADSFNLWRLIGSGVFVAISLAVIVFLIFRAKTFFTTTVCCVLMIPAVLFGRNFFTEILRLDPADDAKIRQELSGERERNRSLQNEIDFLRHAQLSIQDLERIMELNLLKTTLHQTEVKDTWIGTQKLFENRGDKRTQYASVGKNYLVILTHDLTAKYGINMKELRAYEDESGRLVVSGVKPIFTGMTGVSDKKQYAEVVNSFFSADWCVNEFHRKVETMEDLDSNVYEQVSDSAENLLTVILSPTGKEIVFSQEDKEGAVPLMDYLQQKIDEKKKLLSE